MADRREPYRSCRTETVEVDGVQVVALVQGGAPFTEADRAAFSEVYRAARLRHRQRTPLAPLLTRYAIARALLGHVTGQAERRAAANAVHAALVGDAWVIADHVPTLEPGDEVAVRWLDRAGYHHGKGRVTFTDGEPGSLRVELHTRDRRGDHPGESEHG